MTIKQSKKLRPLKDKVIFAGHRYRFVKLWPPAHLVIFDEPNSTHEDIVLVEECGVVKRKRRNVPLTRSQFWGEIAKKDQDRFQE